MYSVISDHLILPLIEAVWSVREGRAEEIRSAVHLPRYRKSRTVTHLEAADQVKGTNRYAQLRLSFRPALLSYPSHGHPAEEKCEAVCGTKVRLSPNRRLGSLSSFYLATQCDTWLDLATA